MEYLEENIEGLRYKNKNYEGRYFVPEATLFDLMQVSTVQVCLKELDIPTYQHAELANDIINGARKCFAILLLIHRGDAILGFFSNDSLQQARPDDRLPYDPDTLEKVFRESRSSLLVRRFLERQWDFAVPVFSRRLLPRTLMSEIILPYIEEECVGEGSFGTVWRTQIHPQSHRLPLKDNKFVRKEIKKPTTENEETFSRELRNLSLLAHLKHSNLVELFFSYQYRGIFNFVFEVAEGGTLDQLLRGRSQIPHFSGFTSVTLIAIADLASGIDAMHNFTADVLDLHLSGCHHDLAPRNILIRNDTFILADFGLSSFRSAEETSLTTFKEVRGSYVGPECQRFKDQQIESSKITRASDIWSFGCILAEVLTYMIHGPEGVERFRKRRLHNVTQEIAWYRFHHGPEKSSPQVQEWLSYLGTTPGICVEKIIALVRDTLSLDPSKRPKSAHVLQTLRYIAILSLASYASTDYAELGLYCFHLDFRLEKMRFGSWNQVFAEMFEDLQEGRMTPFDEKDFEFAALIEILNESRRVLEEIRLECCNMPQRKFSILQWQNSKLLNALPLRYRAHARVHFEQVILQGLNVDVSGATNVVTEKAGDEDIGILIAVKRLSILEERGLLSDRKDLLFKQEEVKLLEDVDYHKFALIEPLGEKVLVEWLKCTTALADETVGKEFRDRITSVAALLHADDKARIPGTLQCRGFYHNASGRAFGLLYRYPALNMNTSRNPMTLSQLFRADGSYRPVLECRVQLAYEIARTIYNFHSVSWLHRNLYPSNVVFFPKMGVPKNEWARTPYLLGFAASRQNQKDAVSAGPTNLFDYHHPEYLRNRERYREEFDYYGVGMLLLEIGHWNLLSHITAGEKFRGLKPELFGAEVIKTRISPVGTTMGSKYVGVIRKCLESRFDSKCEEDSFEQRVALHEEFKREVVDQLHIILQGLT